MKLITASACVVIALLSAGCAASVEDDSMSAENVGDVELATGSMNGLHQASIRTARLTNEVPYRDLLLGGPLSSAELATPVKSLLGRDAASNELMSYVVACALDDGEEVRFTQDQVSRVYRGQHGLAAEWSTGACGDDCREWVSACVLSHANYLGENLPINLVATPFMPDNDYGAYPYQEASYWGDIFAPDQDQKRYACVNDASRFQRVCGPDTIKCGGFVRGSGPGGEIQACATTCNEASTDGGQPNSTYFVGCTTGGGSSDATMTVWRRN